MVNDYNNCLGRRLANPDFADTAWLEVSILAQADAIVKSRGGYAITAQSLGMLNPDNVMECKYSKTKWNTEWRLRQRRRKLKKYNDEDDYI